MYVGGLPKAQVSSTIASDSRYQVRQRSFRSLGALDDVLTLWVRAPSQADRVCDVCLVEQLVIPSISLVPMNYSSAYFFETVGGMKSSTTSSRTIRPHPLSIHCTRPLSPSCAILPVKYSVQQALQNRCSHPRAKVSFASSLGE